MFLIQGLILVVNFYVNKSREDLNEYVPILESNRETRLESTYISFSFPLVNLYFCLILFFRCYLLYML